MKQIEISKNEAGQRLDKLLAKYLNGAPKSFLYKMLRKKNITLNGKKALGNELLQCKDEVRLYLSDETIARFQKDPPASALPPGQRQKTEEYPFCALDVVYEDEDILLINKPAGMLSQKASPSDCSLVEYLTGYLLRQGSLTRQQLLCFHPAVCNRLDRNTSGLIAAGKSLPGLQIMNRLISERSLKKYYRCIVAGTMNRDAYLKGYLSKDPRTNKVTVTAQPRGEEDRPIETAYHVLYAGQELSLLEVHLITGRSHQIRAHLSSIGHPVLGDAKYGLETFNRRYRAQGVYFQQLHAFRLEFPILEGDFSRLSGKIFCAKEPELFFRLLPDYYQKRGEIFYGDVEDQGAARFYPGGTHQPHK